MTQNLASSAVSIPTEIEKVEGTKVWFKKSDAEKPIEIETSLYDLTPIGVLKSGDQQAILAFGVPCRPCDHEEKKMYLIPILNPSRKEGFVHPGRILNPKDRSTLFESKAYFGRCLQSKTSDILVVFQSEKTTRRKRVRTSKSSYTVELGTHHFIEKDFDQRGPRQTEVQQFVKKKTCIEVPTFERVAIRKTVNLRPDAPLESSEDDNEESNPQ